MIRERDTVEENNDEIPIVGGEQRVEEKASARDRRRHGDEQERHDEHGLIHAFVALLFRVAHGCGRAGCRLLLLGAVIARLQASSSSVQ